MYGRKNLADRLVTYGLLMDVCSCEGGQYIS